MKRLLLTTALVLAIVTVALYFFGRSIWIPAYQELAGKRTTADVVAEYGNEARERMRPYFDSQPMAQGMHAEWRKTFAIMPNSTC